MTGEESRIREDEDSNSAYACALYCKWCILAIYGSAQRKCMSVILNDALFEGGVLETITFF